MLTLTNASLRIAGQLLIESASLTIQKGRKVGLVGKNGSGKTSLFRMIQGELEPDTGNIDIPGGTDIACMAQELPAVEMSAIDFVMSGDRDVARIREEISRAEAREDFTRVGSLHDDLHAAGGYTTRARAEKMLAGLGFAADDGERPMGDFSGGWRVRLNLAHTLMAASDLLLLDEPTNHLDLDAILWLVDWIKHYQGSLILISHDREFLDDCVGEILLLERRRLELFTGNFSAFEDIRATRLSEQHGQYQKQQREIAHMEDFVRRFRYKASKAKQAQSRIKALEKMTRIAPAHVDSPFEFSFRESGKVSDPLIKLEDAELGYDAPVLSHIKLSLRPGDRFGLLGHNGAGKTTLVKSLCGELATLGGEREPGANLRIGYFSQHQVDDLDLGGTPFTHLRDLDTNITDQAARTFLGGFDFQGDKVYESVSTFSGGEKARLALALVAYQAPNLLLMDEPTNHLDMDMRQALTVALQDFNGAVVVISHDRHLLASTVDEFLLVDGGKVQVYDGDLNDYRNRLLGSVAPVTAKEEVSVEAPTDEKASSRANQKRVRQINTRLGTIEKRMERLQTKLAEIEASLSDPEVYNADEGPGLQGLIREQASLNEQISEFEAEWLELSEEAEQLA